MNKFRVWEDSYNEYFIVDNGGNTISMPFGDKVTAQLFLKILEELLFLYDWMRHTEIDISLVWMTNVGNTIEKATGLKIQEVIEIAFND